MEITPFSQEWIEGFVNEAADLGLSPEQADALLKQASFMALMQDPNFAEGFQGEMQKAAINVPVGKMMGTLAKWAPGLAIGGLGIWGAQKGMNAINRNWRKSPEQANLLRVAEESGDPEMISNYVRSQDQLRRNKALADMQQVGSQYNSYRNQMQSMPGMRGGGGGPFGFASR